MKNIVIVLFLLVSVSAYSYELEYVNVDGIWYFQIPKGCIQQERTLIEIVGIDPSSFEVIKYEYGCCGWKDNTLYAKDNNHVYYKGVQIKGADPKSVETFKSNSGYIKDKNYVYLEGKRIIGGADPNTFKPLEYAGYAVDRYGIYYNGTALMYSLPKNYRIFDVYVGVEYDGRRNPAYAISNNRVFFKANEIKGADAATFEVIEDLTIGSNRIYTIAKDKNHIYIDNQIFTQLDVKTFKIVKVDYNSETLPIDESCLGLLPDIDADPFWVREFLKVVVKDKNDTYRVLPDGEEDIDLGTFRLIPLAKYKEPSKPKVPVIDKPIIVDEPIEPEKQPERFPDIKAQYPGGVVELMKFINSNINYPQSTAEPMGGTVIVEFVVKADGTIGNIQILKKVHPSLDKEAIRIVQSMPLWKPASSNGVAVASYFQLPVQFRIEEKK